MSVVFWPSEVEEEGPFAVLRRALARLVGAPDVASLGAACARHDDRMPAEPVGHAPRARWIAGRRA